MLKESNNSRVSRASVKSNRPSDTEINLSYDVMKELRRGMSMHSYSYQEDGDWKCLVKLIYTTLDGKKHEITSTEITL